MPWSTWRRLANLFRRRSLDLEIDEELQFHLDSRIRDNIADGMTPDDARRDARRRFGSPLGVRDGTRDANIAVALDGILQDARFAIRGLRRRPGVAAVAIVTLALGIGANTAIFTIVESLLLRPLPFPESGKLHLTPVTHSGRPAAEFPGLADSDYLAFREHDRSFEATAAFARSPGDADRRRRRGPCHVGHSHTGFLPRAAHHAGGRPDVRRRRRARRRRARGHDRRRSLACPLRRRPERRQPAGHARWHRAPIGILPPGFAYPGQPRCGHRSHFGPRLEGASADRSSAASTRTRRENRPRQPSVRSRRREPRAASRRTGLRK